MTDLLQNGASVPEDNSPRLSLRHIDILDRTRQDIHSFLSGEAIQDSFPIDISVGLNPRTLYRGALATVEQAILDSRGICRHTHDPGQGIDLTHQVTFADPPNRGIARHDPDGGRCHRDKGYRAATPCGSVRCFASSMSPSDDDDIIIRMFHVKRSLSHTECRKNLAKHVFNAHVPDKLFECAGGGLNLFRHYLDPGVLTRELGSGCT